MSCNNASNGEKIVFTSVPKCGTHMILQLLNSLNLKCCGPYGELFFKYEFIDYIHNLANNSYSAWHYTWSEEINKVINNVGARVIFLYRDPRSHLCSYIHFINKTPEHPLHRWYTEHHKTNEERMIGMIRGELALMPTVYLETDMGERTGPEYSMGNSGSVNKVYKSYEGWLDMKDVLKIKFEDIVGTKGGGSDKTQFEVFRKVADFSGVDIDDEGLVNISKGLFGSHSLTFRKGKIDSWKEEFTPRVRTIFQQECGDLLEHWGYPADDEYVGIVPKEPIEISTATPQKNSPWRYHTLRDKQGAILWEGQYDLYELWNQFGLPDDFSGQTVLDIGTASGFFAFEFEKRGAARVVATELPGIGDWDARQFVEYDGPDIPMANKRDFKEAHRLLGSAVETVALNISHEPPKELGRFDWVIFGSLMTHVQDPIRALINVRKLTRGQALIISPYIPSESRLYMHWIQTQGPFDWWVPSKALVPQMLKSAGFTTITETGDFILHHKNGTSHHQACWIATPDSGAVHDLV